MKKGMQVFAMVLTFAMISMAQDMPRAEAFLGYTYTRINSATNVPAFSANGGGGDFAINFNPWFGFVTDLGIVKNGNIDDRNIDTTLFPFLFGPRVTVRTWAGFTPYFQYLLGGVYQSSSARINLNVPRPAQPIFLPGIGEVTGDLTAFSARVSASQTAFAQALGGGINVRISNHVSIRPVGLDWLMTRLQNFRTDEDNNQHNLRYSAGVNFTFGAQ